MDDLNIAVIRGTLTNDPIYRELPGGDSIAQFDVATSVNGDRSSVPVSWPNPNTTWINSFMPGESLVVVGRIQRRFFRAGGATQSRTELVAERVVPARRVRSTRALLSLVAAQFEELT